ncbi:MAG TPA: GIY-YIG nuclease family protein [Oxalicibacterium sp.]
MRIGKAEQMGNRKDAAMTWFLYLIECCDGSIYTGIAVDVAARFAAHASGKGARYTRSHPPRRLLVIVAYPDRSSALKAEYAMKQLSAADKRRFCLRREGLWRVAAQLAEIAAQK